MKKILLSALIAMSFIFGYSQTDSTTDESPISFGAEFVSRYIWRGINLGGSNSHIQPYMEYAPKNTGIVLGVWGSHGIASSTGAELDLYLNYSPIDLFTIGVTDYYAIPSETDRNRYFYWGDGDDNSHSIEATASFNGTEKIPLTILFGMIVYGVDGIKPSGEAMYAKYTEIGYTFNCHGAKWSPFVGIALDDPKIANGGEAYYDNNSWGVINSGITMEREMKISNDYSLPIKGQLICNPEAENVFFVFGISF